MKNMMLSNYIKLRTLIVLLLLVFPNVSVGQSVEITPSHTFSILDLVERSLDIVIKYRNMDHITELKLFETDLTPMHAYQMGVAVVDALIVLQKKEGKRPIPKIVAVPTHYKPSDVIQVAEMLLKGVNMTFPELQNANLEIKEFKDKTPTDIFHKYLSIFIKIRAISYRSDITSNETFAEITRAVSDVKSILFQIDPARRYRIDAPKSTGTTSSDVFRECILLRHDMNALKEYFKLKKTQVPEIEKETALHPADVFVQLQLIISELNILKIATRTISLTPLAIPVTEKKPSDVHQQVVMARYLLAQIVPLKEMVEKK